jgi:DNA-binding IclR family transcriptional regulator
MISNQSLQRGLTILDLLDRAAAPIGIRELARLMEMSPTIVQRLTNTLVVAGYVEQVAETRRYKLGYRAMQLGGAMITEDRLISLAAKELQELADNHQLNGYLGALRNNRVVYLHSVQSSGPVVVRVSAGSQVNPHSTALGKILLAYLPVSDVRTVVGKPPYEQFTPRTVTQWSALSAELETTRRRGFAIAREENISGIISFGAVIRSANGDPVSALSVACLAVEEAKWPAILQLVIDAAHRCSVSLGYRGAAIKVPNLKELAA